MSTMNSVTTSFLEALNFETGFAGLALMIGMAFSLISLRELPKLLEPIIRSALSVSESGDRLIKKRIDELDKISKSKNGLSSLEITFEELDGLLSSANKDPFKDSNGEPISDWKQSLIESRARLVEETDRLSSRSVLNLTIGILIALVGVVILVVALFVFVPKEVPSGIYEFSSIYLSRFLLVISVQVLAAFFLRMYVSMERDIKANKNEITNIELRYTAGLLANDKKTSLKEIALILANEERNTTTPNIKSERNETRILKQLTELEKLISKLGS